MNINVNSYTNFYGIQLKKPIKNAVLKNSTSNTTNNSIGKLNEYNMNTIMEIRDLFEIAHSTIKNIAKSCNTRNAIKNGYKNLKKGVAGSRILEFTNIGNNCEDIAVNLRIEHGKYKKTLIFIGDKQLVINPKGQIEKNSTMKFSHQLCTREKNDKLEFFSQKEIDNLETEKHFFALKNELKKYIDYIISRQEEIKSIREKRAYNIPGKMNKYQGIIDSINTEFKFFKSNINKLSYNKLDVDLFKIYNKIKTFHAQNSILIKNATPDGRSLYLVNSKISKMPAMKLFLMDYNNKKIDKSFIIYENKLLKFSPKRVNEKPCNKKYLHYYTQDEIDNSDMQKYLYILNERLVEINYKLKHGINERLNK